MKSTRTNYTTMNKFSLHLPCFILLRQNIQQTVTSWTCALIFSPFFRFDIIYLVVHVILLSLSSEVRVKPWPPALLKKKKSEEIQFQAIVVAVDSVFLVLQALGFKVDLSNAAKKGLIKTISFAIKSCKKTLSAIFAFGSAWTSARGDVIKQALAVLQLTWHEI